MKEKTAKKILKKLEALEETMNVILGASLLDKLTNKHIPDFESGGYVFNSKTNDTNIFPTHEEVMNMFPSSNHVVLTDERDITELNRRMNSGLCQQKKEELYSVNPDFDGVYTY